jgi:hypothetical protein
MNSAAQQGVATTYLQALPQQVALPAGAKRSLNVALKHCKQHDASKHG